MLRFLEREGFSVLRIRGSHHFLNRGDIDTVVPVHGNRPLKTGTLRKILRDIDMTPAEFADRLKE
jgi:predicted RNA binding protein YcfA (HicA-like mRNA interferase family)